MSWPRDDAKLERVRALMAEHELDALVVRAPDNVLYLTNFWGMKGYDACVFPHEGEPVLICLEASEEDAARMAWTSDLRLFKGYDASTRGRRRRASSSSRGKQRAVRARRPRALARDAGGGPDGRRADDIHRGVVHGVRRRGRRHAAPRRCAGVKPTRRSSAAARNESPRRRWSTASSSSARDERGADRSRVGGVRPR